jgi:hypothetical protein
MARATIEAASFWGTVQKLTIGIIASIDYDICLHSLHSGGIGEGTERDDESVW